jgi:hypothetical protein
VAEREWRHNTDGGDDIEYILRRVYTKIAQYVMEKVVK